LEIEAQKKPSTNFALTPVKLDANLFSPVQKGLSIMKGRANYSPPAAYSILEKRVLSTNSLFSANLSSDSLLSPEIELYILDKKDTLYYSIQGRAPILIKYNEPQLDTLMLNIQGTKDTLKVPVAFLNLLRRGNRTTYFVNLLCYSFQIRINKNKYKYVVSLGTDYIEYKVFPVDTSVSNQFLDTNYFAINEPVTIENKVVTLNDVNIASRNVSLTMKNDDGLSIKGYKVNYSVNLDFLRSYVDSNSYFKTISEEEWNADFIILYFYQMYTRQSANRRSEIQIFKESLDSADINYTWIGVPKVFRLADSLKLKKYLERVGAKDTQVLEDFVSVRGSFTSDFNTAKTLYNLFYVTQLNQLIILNRKGHIIYRKVHPNPNDAQLIKAKFQNE
jgi:hypothetical protein